MLVRSLHVYPIKSARGLDPQTAKVEPWGLSGDRRWMLVDEDGVLISARTEARLFLVTPKPEPGGALIVEGPHAAPLRLVPPTGSPIPVQVHRSRFVAIPAGPVADAWFGALLGRDDVRLVWMDDPMRRPTNPDYSEPTDRVSLADGYPLLLTTTASLEQLNDWIATDAAERGQPAQEPLSMRRFRPNVVVDEADVPFAEDVWKRIRVGDVDFRVVKPCTRCVMTTIEPDTLAKGKEPLRTLARHHKWNGETWFGMNIIPDRPDRSNRSNRPRRDVMHVGDPVEVLA